MTHIIDAYPYTYEEDARIKVWKDAMVEEHQSIMKKCVGRNPKARREVGSDFKMGL
jgi:hypothetical protein